jgi:hypothetical protein
MYWQVGRLGDDYKDWVHIPVDKPLRLFYSDFCEFFSKAPWQLIPSLWIPVALIFIYMSYCSFLKADEVNFLGEAMIKTESRFSILAISLAAFARPEFLLAKFPKIWNF